MILGVGCDIVSLKRIESAQKKGLSNRILTESEKVQFAQLKEARAIEFLAGRFAAKEAVFKAINHHRKLSLCEIELSNDETGKPVCLIEGVTVHCSLAHEKEFAIAYVVVES